ncbi:MAG TPA: DUF1080 domain-containing protein [Pirellulales bacterium]|jgi:hypothetical protein|nr:DUF1080 domain-containing protein [Pirellulales bacterium]
MLNSRSLRLWASLVLGLLSGAPLAAAEAPNTLSREEIAEGWILLFDGETDFGWKASGKANWKVADGAISVSDGEKGLFCTTSEFGDYVLKADFRAEKSTNSGIFLRTPARPTDPKSDCYELNIAADDNPFPTGSFVGRKKCDGGRTTGDWQSYEATADGGHFTIKLDGKRVLDYVDPKPVARGLIGLQLNSGPVEFRNVKLKPLGLKSIFNGRDLSGWKVFPGKQSKFSVTPKGELNVKNGPGALESEAQFGDFVLQLEVFSNGKHLNSGIFFRSIPGEFSNGYESQIQNGYKDGDRTQPVDFGTGAIYRRQKARKVVSNDFEWFSKTLVVSGDHVAVWVDGYPVTDWTDTRPPNANPRQGLRREAGTLILQGHDPTTDLSFRNLRAAETPGERDAPK